MMDTHSRSPLARVRSLNRVLSRRRFVALATVPVLAGVAPAAMAQGSGPSVEIVSPEKGAKITSADIPVQIKVSNFKVDCRQAGRLDEPGVGHIHVMVGGTTMAQLINFYCGDSFTLPGVGLPPGKLTLYVALADNAHVAMMSTMKSVDIDFAPAHPVALPKPDFTGTPGVELVSPKDGATVPPVFPVTVKPVHFHPDAALEGKANVPGYGHYHVFVDTAMGSAGTGMMAASGTEAGMMTTPASKMTTPAGMMSTAESMMGTPAASGGMAMMSMAGMVLMPGTNTFTLDLTAWGKGEHTIWIEPVQDDHTHYEQFGHVQFKVKVQ